ncbi:unnamed protein product [Phyllotreta striolata]|uniref:Pre-rRNA-processing protein Ipi1 N-terminal domain-containing protein n=1 Tax=Phyllotreta striolata TaxID=444603 RepID=A0A9N9XJ87_PHYSR|nr:unnamed protein product [Phyllotreta striolata]
MGKNHRHKKNLKADKAKVKLKQTKTKFLPKGLNETKATFKIKPIVLAEQLKERSNEAPLSKRKLDVKDLCNRMQHYNENVRRSACEDLTDMFRQYSEDIIRDNLDDVILNISNLMQDRDRKVRNAVVKALNIILELTDNEKLEPFFKYFSVNMRCAMTHIDQGIQEDSLKFLDCFLVRNCGLVANTSNKLLPDFFTLISRLKNESSLGRTLTLNLGSKITTVSWRIKVLSRLHAVLELILENNKRDIDSNVDYDANESNTFPIYKNHFYEALTNPSLEYWESLEDDTCKNTLDIHLSTLIPIFHDISMEVLPDKKVYVHEGTCLNEESLAILWSIVNTMYLLWKYVEKNQSANPNLMKVFTSDEATTFLGHLMKLFPYSQNENTINTAKSALKLFDTNLDPNCVKENIMLCYICFVLHANIARDTIKKDLVIISSYINKCLLTKNYINQHNIQYFIEVLRLCLLEKSHLWKKTRVDVKKILENVLVFYHSVSIGEKQRMKLFKILADLLDNPYLSKSSQYQSWLASLAELLCKPQISDTTVETLLELARKNCSPFLSAVKSNFVRILDNLDSLNIVVTKKSYKDEAAVKREIVYIFYYLRELSSKEFKMLIIMISKHVSEEDCQLIKGYLQKQIC